jgi:hypothetical protein
VNTRLSRSAGLIALLMGARAFAQIAPSDIPAANPARPTVSTPATLPPAGYVQFETGILIAADSPSFDKQISINQVTKLALNKRLEVFVGSEPWASTSLGHGYRSDDGDVAVGVQAVLLPGAKARPTIALSYAGRVHAGSAADIDIGSFTQGATLLVSGDVKKIHYDVNAIATEQKNSGVRRGQFGQTLSVSHNVGRWTISGELWHFSQPFLRGNAVGNLYAVSYTVRPNLNVDAGFNHGLTSTSTQWEGFCGFTYLLPHRLWGRR